MTRNKMAILIADSYDSPYLELRNEIHPTIWNAEIWSNFDIYYMKGKKTGKIRKTLNTINELMRNSRFGILVRINDGIWLNFIKRREPSIVQKNSDLFIDIPEGLRNLGYKFKTSLNYLYTKEYEIVIKTTSSSLFRKSLLEKFITEKNSMETYLYAGAIINSGEYQFASGANLILNSNTIKLILSGKYRWDHSVLDDVAIGKIMKKAGVNVTEFRTLNIENMENLENLNETTLNDVGHYRCRNFESPRKDSIILMNLAKKMGLIR